METPWTDDWTLLGFCRPYLRLSAIWFFSLGLAFSRASEGSNISLNRDQPNQTIDVSGRVSDANGPLPAAHVRIKGTDIGTQTDFDGYYRLDEVEADAVLVVSFVGYETLEVPVEGRSVIDIVLLELRVNLQEVILFGYGTTTVEDATGSVASVRSDEFVRGVVTTPEQLLQGKTAGVNIFSTSGEPGADIIVNVRGSNSIRGNNNPLFVVDGIPLPEGANNPNVGDNATRNPLTFLNPNDIESVSILKDASSTAIYGSRGANGVVIIETKSGRTAQQGYFEFRSEVNIASPTRTFDLLDRERFLEGYATLGGDPSAVDFGADTDWQDVVLRTSVSLNQDLAYTVNYGSGNLRATIGHRDQQGIVRNSSLERLSGRINWNQRLFDDRLAIELRASASQVDENQVDLFGVYGSALSTNPTVPLAGGLIADNFITPNEWFSFYRNVAETRRHLINGSLSYRLLPGLRLKAILGYDWSEGESINQESGDFADNFGVFGQGVMRYGIQEQENELFDFTVDYQRTFDESKLHFLLGYSFQRIRSKSQLSVARGFSSGDFARMDAEFFASAKRVEDAIQGPYQQYGYGAGSEQILVNRIFPEVVAGQLVDFEQPPAISGLVTDLFDVFDDIQSVFTRVEYTLLERYLLTATVRYDGSSRFGPENRYGWFPSGALAWNMAKEAFTGPNVSTLKLRLSAGVTGNQEGLGHGNFVNRQRFFPLQLNPELELFPSGLGVIATDNPDLKWEETFNANIGLDLGWANDRYKASLDLYRSVTTDLLLQTPPASPAISPFQFQNIEAEVVNQGVELVVDLGIAKTEELDFRAAFNIAYNHNEVQNYKRAGIVTASLAGPGLSGAVAQRFDNGQSLNSFYLAVFEGFDPNGFPIYEDVDGDGIRDPGRDKRFVGADALPDVTSGLSLFATYRNWDFSALFTGQSGFSIYNNNANAFFNTGTLITGQNVSEAVLDSPENPSATPAASTRYLERGDFIRFQNASLGYSVPLGEKSALRSLRFTFTGQNLFLITGYGGLDPEVNVSLGTGGSGIPSRGIDYLPYPRPRTFTLGVNLTF